MFRAACLIARYNMESLLLVVRLNEKDFIVKQIVNPVIIYYVASWSNKNISTKKQISSPQAGKINLELELAASWNSACARWNKSMRW